MLLCLLLLVTQRIFGWKHYLFLSQQIKTVSRNQLTHAQFKHPAAEQASVLTNNQQLAKEYFNSILLKIQILTMCYSRTAIGSSEECNHAVWFFLLCLNIQLACSCS